MERATNPRTNLDGGSAAALDTTLPLNLNEFCEYMLGSLSRADQRRWGEVYIRALVEMPGRKSIPRMAERLATASGQQSLQQFINQSPWRWEPVRKLLAESSISAIPGQVWVIDEIVFPKYGSSSVGVAVQFVPSLQRTARCQLGLGLFLVGEDQTVPVNWRLMIPNTPEHQPEQQADGAETPQARWDYVFELLDEILGDWSLPPLPVILDARGLPELGVLVAGLEARSLGYFIQVSPGTTLPATGGDPMTGAGQVGAPRPDPATPTGRPRPGRRRRLLSPQGARSPRSLWLTNLDARGQADVAKMTRQRWRPRQTLQELQELHGLQHFEGRSLRGWHHHVTLVSLAHFFEILISFQNF